VNDNVLYHTLEQLHHKDREIDGRTYAVLDDFENKKRHLIPFKEEYGQLRRFRVMQYDGDTLQYAPQRSAIEKTVGSKARQLPEKEK
jgi:hypothetical protein